VIANVGGDLKVESPQDTSTYRETGMNTSAGFGAGGLSGGVSKSNVKGDYANVTEQSGLVAGSGGYHVTAGGGVDLKGGVIASTAEKEKNSLTADHLTYSDVENTSKASASRVGVNLGPTGIPVPVVGQPVEEEDHGVARATLTPGNLSLANQNQDLASLNTDLSNANSQVDPLNIARLKAKQQSAAALSELLNSGIGDLSEKLGLEEGSLAKTSLHTFAAAFVAATTGGDIGSAALAGALSEIANGALQDVLEADPSLSNAQKSAITQWIAAAVGAAAGGQAGAAVALDNVNYNYLNHPDNEKLNKARASCANGDRSACAEKERLEAKDNKQQQDYINCRNGGYSGANCAAVLSDAVASLSSYAGTVSYWSSKSERQANFDHLDATGGLDQVRKILAPNGTGDLTAAQAETLVQTINFLLTDPLMILGLPNIIEKANSGDPAAIAQVVTIAARLKLLGAGAESIVKHKDDEKTGTVWDDITKTAGDLPNTKIPATFKLKIEDMEFYVNSNATKHMAEYLQKSSNPINDQVLLRSFSDAVKEIQSSQSLEFGKLYNANGWEIVFSKRSSDLVPVIKHALYKP